MIEAFLGGILIGTAAVILLLFNGRIAGNSGIVAQCIPSKEEGFWRLCYLSGLVVGGFLYQLLFPGDLRLIFHPSLTGLIAAGLLVGIGTRIGGGCTSGHGICGMARLSPRSIVATVVFVAAAMVTVWLVRQSGGAWW
jgi:uncharacterized membrane protein YedE/YeeE